LFICLLTKKLKFKRIIDTITKTNYFDCSFLLKSVKRTNFSQKNLCIKNSRNMAVVVAEIPDCVLCGDPIGVVVKPHHGIVPLECTCNVSFCLTCFRDLLGLNKRDDEEAPRYIKCPICRLAYRVSVDDITAGKIPSDRLYVKLQDKMREYDAIAPMSCRRCGQDGILRTNMFGRHPDAHSAVCPEMFSPCEFGCRGAPIKRKDLPAHYEVCPLYRIPCPDGCDLRICRRDLVRHADVCQMVKSECEDCGKMIMRCHHATHSCHMLRDIRRLQEELDHVREAYARQSHELNRAKRTLVRFRALLPDPSELASALASADSGGFW
jgi:hypothetical protein